MRKQAAVRRSDVLAVLRWQDTCRSAYNRRNHRNRAATGFAPFTVSRSLAAQRTYRPLPRR